MLGGPWLGYLLLVVALFLLVWGRERRRTEALIREAPWWLGPHYWLSCLEHLDLLLTPRDLKHEQYLRNVLTSYGPYQRMALRKLLDTNNTNLVPQCEDTFKSDGLLDYPKDGPGAIKEAYRDSIRRLLDDLGVP